MRNVALAAAALMPCSGLAVADPGNSKGKENSDQAQAMASGLQANKGAASVASQVSGNNPELGIGGHSASGWGNTGSSLDDGTSVSGKISAD